MEKQRRIHWKKGLDITPEILIDSDNYHIAERNILGRFFASRLYGILPGSLFRVEKNMDTNGIQINNLECVAITQDGAIINIQNDTPFKKRIEFIETAPEFYVVVTVNSYLPIDEKEASNFFAYNLVIKSIKEPIENGIPILKIINDNQNWRIDDKYIPPSIALNSVDSLKRKFFEIRDIIYQIIEKFQKDDSLYLPIAMLQLELNNYTLKESPETFVLLLKKICWIFQSYLKKEKNIEKLSVIEKFMLEKYIHSEIDWILNLGFESLVEINQKIEEKPVEEVIQEDVFEIKI